MAGFSGADNASARNTLFPPDDPSQIWRSDNPVGTETVQSLGMPQPTNYAGSAAQLTQQAMSRMDNPLLGFDTGGIGGVLKGYHGSPHAFDHFDNAAIGSGEGAQAYGYGHYLADSEGVARSYRDALTPKFTPNPERKAVENEFSFADAVSRKAMTGPEADFNAALAARDAAREKLKNTPELIPNPSAPGHMYEVNVAADPEHFLDWDKPLSEQHPVVQKALKDSGAWDATIGRGNPQQFSGRHAYDALAEMLAKPPPETGGWTSAPGGPVRYDAQVHNPGAASQALQQAGIPGIRYLDQGSRAAGEGSRNTVVFSPEIMQVIRRYGLAGLMAGGGAAALPGQSQGQGDAP